MTVTSPALSLYYRTLRLITRSLCSKSNLFYSRTKHLKNVVTVLLVLFSKRTKPEEKTFILASLLHFDVHRFESKIIITGFTAARWRILAGYYTKYIL